MVCLVGILTGESSGSPPDPIIPSPRVSDLPALGQLALPNLLVHSVSWGTASFGTSPGFPYHA